MYVSGLIYFFDLMGAKPADFIKYPTINLPSFKKIPPGSGKPADIIQIYCQIL